MSFCGFCAALLKRETRKGRGVAMGEDSFGIDLEMCECNKNRYRGKHEKCFSEIIFRPIFLTQEKFLPRASGFRFTHPCRRNITDVCPPYADVFSWWMGFADVTRGAEA